MERKRYLELCQSSSIGKEVFVVTNGIKYKPYKYMIGFNKDGSATHTAVLLDVSCNSILDQKLERVEEYEKENY